MRYWEIDQSIDVVKDHFGSNFAEEVVSVLLKYGPLSRKEILDYVNHQSAVAQRGDSAKLSWATVRNALLVLTQHNIVFAEVRARGSSGAGGEAATFTLQEGELLRRLHAAHFIRWMEEHRGHVHKHCLRVVLQYGRIPAEDAIREIADIIMDEQSESDNNAVDDNNHGGDAEAGAVVNGSSGVRSLKKTTEAVRAVMRELIQKGYVVGAVPPVVVRENSGSDANSNGPLTMDHFNASSSAAASASMKTKGRGNKRKAAALLESWSPDADTGTAQTNMSVAAKAAMARRLSATSPQPESHAAASSSAAVEGPVSVRPLRANTRLLGFEICKENIVSVVRQRRGDAMADVMAAVLEVGVQLDPAPQRSTEVRVCTRTPPFTADDVAKHMVANGETSEVEHVRDRVLIALGEFQLPVSDSVVRKLDNSARRATPAAVKKIQSQRAGAKAKKQSIALLADLTDGVGGVGPVSCYTVDWQACRQMFENAIAYIIMQTKFGMGGSRVFQFLATHGGAAAEPGAKLQQHFEDKEVIEGCLLHANHGRTVLNQLMMHGIISSKESVRNGQVVYVFSVSESGAREFVESTLYKSVFNARLRYRSVVDEHADLIFKRYGEHQTSAGGTDAVDEATSAQNLQDQANAREDAMEGAFLDLDRAILLLTQF